MIDSTRSSSFRFTGSAVVPPALADLDGDSDEYDDLEIIMGGGVFGKYVRYDPYAKTVKMHVFDLVGTSLVETTATDSIPPGLRKEAESNSEWTPIALDIDGDGKIEFMTAMNSGFLSVWEWDNGVATPERGWPQLFPDVPSTPLVAEIDDSGDLAMVVQDRSGWVHVFDLPGDTTGVNYDWAQFGHDAHNTSFYGHVVPGEGRPARGRGPNAQAWAGSQTLRLGPNPLQDRGQLRFSTRTLEHVQLEVYDITGRRIRTILDQQLPIGQHVIEWDGKDDRTHAVSSGVYFYRLEVGQRTQVRKIIVAR